jgi:predicted SprT family Zn-dependent metalloprotease
MDSFWQQDVINDWNDEYSPRKVLHPKQEFNYDGSIPINMTDPSILPKRSPVKQDRITKEAKKSFNKTKYELAESFLLELDTKVTNGEISRLAKLSGGVKILWNKKLNTTAGRANWKRETLKPMLNPTMEDGTMLPRYRHYAYIELAEKIIDDEDRLLNTIAHEFCHLTTFMIDNMKENPHGKEFKVWGAKVTRMFRHRGIEVTTKHSYQIDYKYVWECENCGIEFKRHSKSIDPERQRCGTCKSRLVQIKPVPRVGKENGGKEKSLGEYQMFVKANMTRVREENPGSPQKEIMSLVGKKYHEYKASKLNGSMTTVEMINTVEGLESRQLTPEQDRAAFISRKLDFLDLTRE